MGLFNKEYFFGRNSNYKDYRKIKYLGLACDIATILKLDCTKTVLDYGCATGCLVKELMSFTPNVFGTDISQWAIEFGIKQYKLENNIFPYDKYLLCFPIDYVIMLDVLEHCTNEELRDVFTKINKNKRIKKIVVRIPVSLHEGEDYYLDISKNDKTHIQIHCKDQWEKFFKEYGFKFCEALDYKRIYDSIGVLAWVIGR